MTPATSRPCPWAGREGPRIHDKRPAGIAQNEDLTTFFCDNGRARSRIRRAARPPERAGSTKGPQEPRLSTQHRAPGAQVVPQVPRKMVTIFKFFINIKGQTELNFLRKKCPARCKKVRGMPRTANKDDPPLATGLFTPPHPRARFHSFPQPGVLPSSLSSFPLCVYLTVLQIVLHNSHTRIIHKWCHQLYGTGEQCRHRTPCGRGSHLDLGSTQSRASCPRPVPSCPCPCPSSPCPPRRPPPPAPPARSTA